MIIELADGANERLAGYAKLTDVVLRRRLETQQGLCMAESSKVITRAVAAGYVLHSFPMAPCHLEEMRPVIASAAGCGNSDDGGGAPVFVAPEEVLKSITRFHPHRGALAAMGRPGLAGIPELPSSARGGAGVKRVTILEGLVGHTSAGTVFCSAAALGTDTVLVTPRCADPLHRRSVRVFMGTVFQVPQTRIERWPTIDELHAQDFTMAALVLSDISVTLSKFAASPACTAPDSRVVVVLDMEGDGLSHRTIIAADEVVRIPMVGGVDSLNVATVATVAFWALHLP